MDNFQDALGRLIKEWQDRGADTDEIISDLELAKMALEEEQ